MVSFVIVIHVGSRSVIGGEGFRIALIESLGWNIGPFSKAYYTHIYHYNGFRQQNQYYLVPRNKKTVSHQWF